MKPSALSTPTGYATWLAHLKKCIRETRVRAALAVNSELIGLYWRIERDIVDRQAQHVWAPTCSTGWPPICEPNSPMHGFFSADLCYMRALAEAWLDHIIRQRVACKLP